MLLGDCRAEAFYLFTNLFKSRAYKNLQMVILVNEQGEVQDLEPYKRRINVPPEKKADIRSYVRRLETKLNACEPTVASDESRWYPDHFGKLMRTFLGAAVYANSLLDEPYLTSDRTSRQMFDFWDSWLGSNLTYDLEKMVRLGLKEILRSNGEKGIFKAGWKGSILHEEKLLYMCNRKLLIKVLSRYPGLGLPDIDPEKKAVLQDLLDKNPGIMNNSWLGCSAKRAGFTLPPISSEYVDAKIRTWIEQEEERIEGELLILAVDLQVEREIEESREDYLFSFYLSTLHHLHSLLEDGKDHHFTE